MQMKLEVVHVPVSDVDRAKAFYTEQIGFNADHDHQVNEELRFVQLTPPGSACSIAIGTGLTQMEPGSIEGLMMVVADVQAARDELMQRGPDVSRSMSSRGVHLSISAILMGTPGYCNSCPIAANTPDRMTLEPTRRPRRRPSCPCPHGRECGSGRQTCREIEEAGADDDLAEGRDGRRVLPGVGVDGLAVDRDDLEVVDVDVERVPVRRWCCAAATLPSRRA